MVSPRGRLQLLLLVSHCCSLLHSSAFFRIIRRINLKEMFCFLCPITIFWNLTIRFPLGRDFVVKTLPGESLLCNWRCFEPNAANCGHTDNNQPVACLIKLLFEQILRCSWLWRVSGRTFRVASPAALTWTNKIRRRSAYLRIKQSYAFDIQILDIYGYRY